jgi:aminoglycoside phosphotransferase family enzyme
MDLIDSVMGRSLNLKYKDYNRDNAKPFALEREVDLNDEKKTNIFINFSKVKINEPLKFPFTVKEKYE